jgi:23S rRNA pseudouridine1911/1915/1917 synthase
MHFFHPSWPVIHEDNHLLALYKPAGLLVQGDSTGDATLLELGKRWLKERYGKPGNVYLGLVHRLDRPVAGVVLMARTSKAAGRLSMQFRSGTVRKRYLAVVEGKLKDRTGFLVNHIEREDRHSKIVPAPTPRSQEARLHYQVLGHSSSRTFLEIRLETGRRHQIRLQLAHLCCPIVGDLRYGASGPLPEKQIALFAEQIGVEHPVRKERLVFRSPLPRGWPWPSTAGVENTAPWNWSELSLRANLS